MSLDVKAVYGERTLSSTVSLSLMYSRVNVFNYDITKRINGRSLFIQLMPYWRCNAHQSTVYKLWMLNTYRPAEAQEFKSCQFMSKEHQWYIWLVQKVCSSYDDGCCMIQSLKVTEQNCWNARKLWALCVVRKLQSQYGMDLKEAKHIHRYVKKI